MRVYFQTIRQENSRERYSIKVFEVKLDSTEASGSIKITKIGTKESHDLKEINCGDSNLYAQLIEMPFLPDRKLIGVFCFKR